MKTPSPAGDVSTTDGRKHRELVFECPHCQKGFRWNMPLSCGYCKGDLDESGRCRSLGCLILSE